MKKTPKPTLRQSQDDTFAFANTDFLTKTEVAKNLVSLYRLQNTMRLQWKTSICLNRTPFGLAVQNATLEGIKMLTDDTPQDTGVIGRVDD